MKVEIKQRPAMRVAAVRHVGPYTEIGKAFEQLGRIAESERLPRAPAPSMLAIYYDDPARTAPAELRSDAALVVPENAKLPKSLAEQRIAAGEYACAMHVGPYETLPSAWRQLLGEWLPASGKRVAGPSIEVYHNMPGQVPPEQLRTELCVPVG